MVGHPKHLSDLKKIDADVRFTCRRCGFEDDWSPEDLAKHLLEIGGSQVWSEITRYLHCRRVGCGSPDLRILPVPYARRPANLPRRVGKLDSQLLGTALQILEAAVARSPGRSVAGVEVRLALLVVHGYARDRQLVRDYWECAGDAARNVSEGLSDPYARLRKRLEQLGWVAPAVNLDRVHTWPWNSPAPPGWRAAPGYERPDAD